MADTLQSLAVLGSPIAHSQSPALHRAAYRELGLDWSYEAIDVTTDSLGEFLRTRGPEWRGLSLTMPLKNAVLHYADSVDGIARLTRAANTVLFRHDTNGRSTNLFNTDVWGIQQAFERSGVLRLDSVVIVGGGATAASAAVAATRLGAREVTIAARTPAKAAFVVELATQCGANASATALDSIGTISPPTAVISTVPGGASMEMPFPTAVLQSSVLFDVAYDPWPSALARQWSAAGGRVIPGIDMLIFQALVQIRIFTSGTPERPLADEDSVVSAMRSAVCA